MQTGQALLTHPWGAALPGLQESIIQEHVRYIGQLLLISIALFLSHREEYS